MSLIVKVKVEIGNVESYLRYLKFQLSAAENEYNKERWAEKICDEVQYLEWLKDGLSRLEVKDEHS